MKIQFIIHFYALVVHLEGRESAILCASVSLNCGALNKLWNFLPEREKSLLTISALTFIQRLILVKNRENILLSLYHFIIAAMVRLR